MIIYLAALLLALYISVRILKTKNYKLQLCFILYNIIIAMLVGKEYRNIVRKNNAKLNIGVLHPLLAYSEKMSNCISEDRISDLKVYVTRLENAVYSLSDVWLRGDEQAFRSKIFSTIDEVDP